MPRGSLFVCIFEYLQTVSRLKTFVILTKRESGSQVKRNGVKKVMLLCWHNKSCYLRSNSVQLTMS